MALKTTTMAPIASPWNVVAGTISMPESAMITVIPENSTARLAVFPAATIASTFASPPARSSRKRSTTNSV